MPRERRLLRKSVCEMGVRPLMGAVAERIRTSSGRLALEIRDRGESVAADMVVFAAGIRPRDELGSGLWARGRLRLRRDRRGRRTAHVRPGDSRDRVNAPPTTASSHGLVAPGFRMAETLAAILTGRRSRFDGYSAAIRLRLAGIDVLVPGRSHAAGRPPHLAGKRLLSTACCAGEASGCRSRLSVPGRKSDSRRTPFAMDAASGRGNYTSFWRQDDFRTAPAPRPVTEVAGVGDGLQLPGGDSGDSAHGVQTGDTRPWKPWLEGPEPRRYAVIARPLLSELVGAASESEAIKGHAGLLTAATIAVLLVLMTVYDSPVPPAASVESSRFWDVLYRDGWWRQVTGFALLGCALLAAGFSFRKRWTRVRWGDLAWWRLGHGLAGVLALIVLAAHTGLAPRVGIQPDLDDLVPGRQRIRSRRRGWHGSPERPVSPSGSHLLAVLDPARVDRHSYRGFLLFLTSWHRVRISQRDASA